MSRQWRSLDELVDSRSFRELFAAEFPSLTTAADWKRRDILKCMGAAIALAGLDGCERQPDERAFPYVRQAAGETLGEARFYATALEFDGVAQPVIGKTRAGRPIKLEGNPDHPASGGKTDAFTQAALLDLYDPERSQAVLHKGRIADWQAYDAMAHELARRMDASGGKGFRLLTGATRSPTQLRLIGAMLKRWPAARWHAWSAVPTASTAPDLSRAHAIVSFDHDLLGPGPLQTWNARGWAARRSAYHTGEGEALLFVAEPTPSLTGVTASHRLIAGTARLPVLLAALLDGTVAGLSPREKEWVALASRSLVRNPGRGLVTVGAHHPPALQQLARRLNDQLGNAADGALPAGPVEADPIEPLLAAMHAGEVKALMVLDTNPVYALPEFAEAIERVPLRIHAGLHADETAFRCHWHAPLAHDLESWGDARAADGSVCLIQPLVRPWLDVRSKAAQLATLAGRSSSDHALVRETWGSAWAAGANFEEQWQETLRGGFRPASSEGVTPASAQAVSASAKAGAETPPRSNDELTVLVRADPTVWDGRFSDNPWLQELPKPLTKIVWGNAIHISPALAEEEGLENGDLVELSVAGRSVSGPIWIVPGQERRTILVHLGYGRHHAGTVSENLGFNAALLGPAGSSHSDATLRKVGGRQLVASTQSHFAMAPDEFVRFVPSPNTPLRAEPVRANMYPPLPMTEPSWGMAIDLDLCIGCNACVVACVAENNIATVGKEQVAKGREMHWLRVDRYYEGPPDDARQVFQPVPCMHCENAPCEMGCPVNAAVHSPDGLNLQVYNRCIGTRTCAAYCPYKVRRFNWFDWTKEDAPELQAARNPEVTVRGRGVMEKCTYCIQRLQNARIDGEVDEQPDWATEVQTACQQACPTQAIVFGDVSDPKSPVSRRKANGRDYSLLADANTRPRTTHSARIAREDEA